MHFMATYLFVFVDWAFKTSEKVPSPFLLISLYSVKGVMTQIAPFGCLADFQITPLTVHVCSAIYYYF